MSDDVLVQVEGVSKKFCRSLKRSLWYGVQDVSAEMFGRKGSHHELRKNEFWAVNDVSFELKRGECLGLIGPNGAGKSTLLKMLNGLVKPDQGRITMRGRVGALIELGAGFNPILTARENIYVNGSVLGFTKNEIDRKFDTIVDFAEIEEFIDTPVQNFSSGMKVRLGFAVAAQMEPDVLLIDEVLAVGDARFSAKCINQLSSISKNSSLIVVSHSMPLVSRVSTHGMSIINGQLSCFSGEINRVIEDYLSSVSFSDYYARISQGISVDRMEISGQIINSPNEIVAVDATEPLEIKIGMKSKGIEHPLFANIVFLDLEGKPVAQCLSSNSSFYIDSNQRREFKLVLNSIPLNPGRYFVQLVFVEALGESRFGKILYQNLNEASIAVRGGKLSYAPVQFRGTWAFC